MPAWWRTAATSAVAAAVTGAVVYLVITALRPDPTTETAKARGSAVTVEVAAASGESKALAVTGFVFLDSEAGDLLCSERTRADRPACAGASLVLSGLDISRLDLVRADQPKGGYDAWTRTAVTLVGLVDHATLTVEDIVNP